MSPQATKSAARVWNRAADRESGPLHMTDCRDYTLAGFKINSLVCGTVETKGSVNSARPGPRHGIVNCQHDRFGITSWICS